MGFVGIFKFFVCMNLGNNEYLIWEIDNWNCSDNGEKREKVRK